MANRIVAPISGGVLCVDAIAHDVFRITFKPHDRGSRVTAMMDPKGIRRAPPVGAVDGDALVTNLARATVCERQIDIQAGEVRLLATVVGNTISLKHPAAENLYGIRSYGLHPKDSKPPLARSNGLLRNDGGAVEAGSQGDAGAPLAYSTKWGLLVDSIDGLFTNKGGNLLFKNGSRKDLEAYVILGQPKRVMEVATLLTGEHPMPPKWAFGFLNSHWGLDEKRVNEIVAEYRAKKIPLDCFIFDFDFKAWGEDDFGEWRWNSTSGPGATSPNLFPNGASGIFAESMRKQGVNLMGIMKPRILTKNLDGTPTKAAAEATAAGFWLKKPYMDYFSKRESNDLDFSKPGARQWFWNYSKGLFETGIAGWWNDEADDGFGSLGHFQMQQGLFEGQTAISDKRVFSLNRNFYLGAQRYAYTLWSGDIRTGFANMADQRARMLTALGVVEPYWSMDTGGFYGTPTEENFARWLQFAAVVPIMRVHGAVNLIRQPWAHGPKAERVATEAIRLRYSLLPYLYSLARDTVNTGVGIVRPLHWEFPDDPKCANESRAWMLGEALLTSPVVDSQQKGKVVYLPQGSWYPYRGGDRIRGGKAVRVPCDAENWLDLPLFVRGGSIVPTQKVLQWVSEEAIECIELNVWPDSKRAAFAAIYDDDGETQEWRNGAFFRQEITSVLRGRRLALRFSKPSGRYATKLKHYRIDVKVGSIESATWNGKPVDVSAGLTVPAGVAGRLHLRLAR